MYSCPLRFIRRNIFNHLSKGNSHIPVWSVMLAFIMGLHGSNASNSLKRLRHKGFLAVFLTVWEPIEQILRIFKVDNLLVESCSFFSAPIHHNLKEIQKRLIKTNASGYTI